MAKPYQQINLRDISVQFDKVFGEIKGKMVNTLEEAAKTCLLNVINHEGKQPFKTGSYISSHRVGINEKDTSDTIIKDEGTVTLEAAKSRAMQEMKKIKNINVNDVITISNSVGYSTKYGYSWAGRVEYVGWGDQNGRDPYLVYEQAVAKTLAAMPKITAIAIDKKV